MIDRLQILIVLLLVPKWLSRWILTRAVYEYTRDSFDHQPPEDVTVYQILAWLD